METKEEPSGNGKAAMSSEQVLHTLLWYRKNSNAAMSPEIGVQVARAFDVVITLMAEKAREEKES